MELPKLHLDPLDKSEIEIIKFKVKELKEQYKNDNEILKNILLDFHKIYIFLKLGQRTFRIIDPYFSYICPKCHIPIDSYNYHVSRCPGGNPPALSKKELQQCKKEAYQILIDFNYAEFRHYVLNLHTYINFFRENFRYFKSSCLGICARCHIIPKRGCVRICSCNLRYCLDCYSYFSKRICNGCN